MVADARKAAICRAPRVAEAAQPYEAAVAGAVGQVEPHGMTIEAANGDGALSGLVGEHYVLGREVMCIASFPGLDVSKALTICREAVRRVTILAGKVTIQAD